MKFSNIFSETYTFYDILLIKFLFQYFFKRNDTVFSAFHLICKCTFGLKNRQHLKPASPGTNFSFSDTCVLCNAFENIKLRKHSFYENESICLCED